jgi:RimJ/RimL family protein N-acetyltransferase
LLRYGEAMPRSKPATPPASPLTDGVIALRLRTQSDVDSIAAASSDPEALRWLEDPPMDAAARATSVVRTEEAWRTGASAPMVIADAATDEPIGLVNIQFRSDDMATVAYSVFASRRGQGIAPRALRLVTTWALDEVGLDRLFLEADAENAASLRVAEKCGFQRVDSRADGERTTVVFVTP